MRNRRRCYHHGGKSPGAPTGKANGNFKRGLWTRELQDARALLRAMRKLARELHD